MSDVRPSDDPAVRVALNARIAPDLRRRLQMAVRDRSSTVQDVVEAQLTALLDSIDVDGIRSGTATAPGRATNPRGAETVPLNVRIRVPLSQRIEALVAAVAGTTRQGLAIEALEALGETGSTPDDLWAVIAGTSEPTTAVTKPASKPARKKASTSSTAPVKKPAPVKKTSAKAPADTKKTARPERRPQAPKPAVADGDAKRPEVAEIAGAMNMFQGRKS